MRLPITTATILTLVLFLGGCWHVPAQVPVSPSTEQPTTTSIITTTDSVIDGVNVLEWQQYDEVAEGIKEGVLPNFKFPKRWYTFNIAGGYRVAIYFSDGAGGEESELKRNVNNFETIDDRCGLKVLYNGSTLQYFIERYNNKVIRKKFDECKKILNTLEAQIAK